jgi:hypothetical protein
MTANVESSHRHHDQHPPEPEEDKLPYGKLAWVSVLALASFVIGGLWSTWILYRPNHTLIPEGLEPRAAQVGSAEIGIVDQKMFEQEHRAQVLRQEQRSRLNGYGWVDRQQKIIHMPFERAMQDLAAENKQ